MIKQWLKIIRAYSLFASACPVAVGSLVYLFTEESASWLQLVTIGVTILCAMSLQVVANLVNDYYDFKKGADQQGRAGFERPLAEGTISLQVILRAIFIFIAIAVILGTILVLIGKGIILIIGVAALFFAWLYTATHLSLAYLGLGDLFVLIFYGLIASFGSSYLLSAATCFTWESILDWQSWIYPISLSNDIITKSLAAGAINGLFSMMVLAANNLRDIEDDAPVGKKTFPVRFGKRAGERLVFLEILLVPICAYIAFGWSLPMLMLIPSLRWFYGLRQADGTQYNIYLAKAGQMNLLYTLLVLLQLVFL